jgi:hypothetical protein
VIQSSVLRGFICLSVCLSRTFFLKLNNWTGQPIPFLSVSLFNSTKMNSSSSSLVKTLQDTLQWSPWGSTTSTAKTTAEESSTMKRVDSAKADLSQQQGDSTKERLVTQLAQGVVSKVYDSMRYSKDKLAAMGECVLQVRSMGPPPNNHRG